MHITNRGSIFMEHDHNDFWLRIKMYNFENSTNIAVLLMTAFVLQGHIRRAQGEDCSEFHISDY